MKKLLSLALALVMLLSMAACGGGSGSGNGTSSGDPTLGKYIGYTIEVYGEIAPMSDAYSTDNYIELSAGGKGSFVLDGQTTAITWTLTGNDINIDVEGYGSPGTLKDGVLIIDFMEMGMYYTFVKEGVTPPETIPPEDTTDDTEGDAEVVSSEPTEIVGTVDFGLFTMPYTESCEAGEDSFGDPMISDKAGRYSIVLFKVDATDEDVQLNRDDFEYYKTNKEYTDVEVNTTTLGTMTDVTYLKYNSVLGPEIYYSVRFPEPIEGNCGVEINITSSFDYNGSIDDLLAIPDLQTMLSGIQFKS